MGRLRRESGWGGRGVGEAEEVTDAVQELGVVPPDGHQAAPCGPGGDRRGVVRQGGTRGVFICRACVTLANDVLIRRTLCAAGG